jgi:hypothetical protein
VWLNQRYATSATTGFVVRELSRMASIEPPQEFVVRNDCPCGKWLVGMAWECPGALHGHARLQQTRLSPAHAIRKMDHESALRCSRYGVVGTVAALLHRHQNDAWRLDLAQVQPLGRPSPR